MKDENDDIVANDELGIHEVKCVQSSDCEVVKQHGRIVWSVSSGTSRHARCVSRHWRGLAENDYISYNILI
jgi:hypothetical protein